MTINIIVPESKSELEDARRLGYEYVETIGKNPILEPYFKDQNFLTEIDKMPKGYEPPQGIYLLAYVDNEAAGTAALKSLDNDICEMKRLFVSPKFQGIGLGKLLAERVIDEAKKLGYTKMRLDNSRSVMAKAVLLYKSLGFYEIEPYNENFVADALFMEKIL
jgi:GNAT superfamily N-acetyltransferase